MKITEGRNPRSRDLDIRPTADIIELMVGEELKGLKGILKEKKSIERAINSAVDTFKAGGRLFYVGAGTSGRLGFLDAVETPPTFGISGEKIQAILAGGQRALVAAVEGAEDDMESAKREIRNRAIGSKDMVFGISASGKTPSVIAALKEAKRRRAKVWLLTFNKVGTTRNRVSKPPFVDNIINVIVGPEVLTGSTRLKAGTATKVILNIISTISMIRLGKVYKNLMVNVKPMNKKLFDRAKTIVMQETGVGEKEAEKLLKKAAGRAKVAILMKLKDLKIKDAAMLLLRYSGVLRDALKAN
ncbi:MAG: N-acetylmuramic acid 6-phosphate etherase [Nitrospirae bacterium]|nr:N-acetylmuramic acid 6-phosphate etherase [Nitrospirota bacterium]